MIKGKTRKQLQELQDLIKVVPFPMSGVGSASTSLLPLISYQEDMRQFLPAIKAIITGMLWQGIDGLEEGSDYHDPDKAIEKIKEWVSVREDANWQNPVPRLLLEEKAII
jgi:hypothetical protein